MGGEGKEGGIRNEKLGFVSLLATPFFGTTAIFLLQQLLGFPPTSLAALSLEVCLTRASLPFPS